VILRLPWLLVRSRSRPSRADTAWMPHPCRKNNVNEASTPYAGRPQAGPRGPRRAGPAERNGYQDVEFGLRIGDEWIRSWWLEWPDVTINPDTRRNDQRARSRSSKEG